MTQGQLFPTPYVIKEKDSSVVSLHDEQNNIHISIEIPEGDHPKGARDGKFSMTVYSDGRVSVIEHRSDHKTPLPKRFWAFRNYSSEWTFDLTLATSEKGYWVWNELVLVGILILVVMVLMSFLAAFVAGPAFEQQHQAIIARRQKVDTDTQEFVKEVQMYAREVQKALGQLIEERNHVPKKVPHMSLSVTPGLPRGACVEHFEWSPHASFSGRRCAFSTEIQLAPALPWSWGIFHSHCSLCFQEDGNLVVYQFHSNGRRPLASSGYQNKDYQEVAYSEKDHSLYFVGNGGAAKQVIWK